MPGGNSPAGPVEPFRFSTRGLREPRRGLRLLNERHAVLPIEPVAGAAPEAEIAQWAYPGLGILSATLGGLRHGPAAAAPDDDLYLGITRTGCSIAEQRRDRVILEDGDAVLLSAPDGFRMAHPAPVTFLGLRLSRARLAGRLGSVDDAVMRLIRRDTPALRLLTRYVGLAQDGSLSVGAELRDAVVSHVYDLVAVTIGGEPARPSSGSGIRAARLSAIKADIAASLADPDLSVSVIAARHHVSSRYVHKLFAYEGATYSEFVLAQRLTRVHSKLTDQRFAAVTVSDLAFGAGFGDLSYFNRAFRRRYDATPSEIRRAGAPGGAGAQ